MLKYINGVMNAPEAIGPYSQAVITGNLAFVSGQIGLDFKTGELVEGGIEEQTDRVMKNLAAILGHMSTDFSNVVKTTIYTTNLEDFNLINGIYSKWMGEVRPARSTMQVAALPRGALVEIEMIVMLMPLETLMTFHPSAGDIDEVSKSSFAVSGECRGKNN